MFTIPVDGPPPWGASRMVQAFDNWRVGPINRSLFRSPATATPHTGHSRRSGAVFVQILRAFRPSPQTPLIAGSVITKFQNPFQNQSAEKR